MPGELLVVLSTNGILYMCMYLFYLPLIIKNIYKGLLKSDTDQSNYFHDVKYTNTYTKYLIIRSQWHG